MFFNLFQDFFYLFFLKQAGERLQQKKISIIQKLERMNVRASRGDKSMTITGFIADKLRFGLDYSNAGG